jgi:hypothetical protein
MYEASRFESSAEAVAHPTRATERAKTIFVAVSTTGSLLGLLIAIVANTFLK